MKPDAFASPATHSVSALPPGPKLPAIFQLLRWFLHPMEFLEESARRYGDCFTWRFPGYPPLVFFSDPEVAKELFTGNLEQLRAGEAATHIKPILGEHSLITLDGVRYVRARKLLAPAFHGERVQIYSEVMREITDRSIHDWPMGRPFPLYPRIEGILLDIILQTVFGIDPGTELVRLHNLLGKLSDYLNDPFLLLSRINLGPLSRWGRVVRLRREVDKFLLAEFARRRAEGCDGREDVLSMLIEARDETGQPLNDIEIRDEMMTLLIAGYKPSAYTLSGVFFRLLQHPNVVEKLTAELHRVVGADPVTPQHIPQLEYLDATIKEALRMNSLFAFAGRRLQEPMRIGHYDLPAGVIAAPCYYLTHRRPDIWPDPEQFIPERFIGKRSSPYEFFPFGGGMRHCLGAAFVTYEMKIILAQVLSRVVLRAAPGYNFRLTWHANVFVPSAGLPVILDTHTA